MLKGAAAEAVLQVSCATARQLLDSTGDANTCPLCGFEVWTPAVVVTAVTSMIPAAASVIRDGKAPTVQSPPAQTSAMTTAAAWMENVCVMRASQEKTAAR